uniref:Protein tyrosine phosphatase non-receptor type 13 n=1 Tax=Xenopus tropicalis TaxID=8364 RepID=A0A6I8RTH7_XENTR
MHVSLAEALEVRGGPLEEEELWAVLNQSAESLQELLRRADPAALGFIISPWSLLLLPSGSVSFTDENVSNQDLRVFTAPEVLQTKSLSSLSDIEKMHIYSLGMTLYWGADYEVPETQPIQLGERLNSILLDMCDDQFYTRLSSRTVLDGCSTHIRNSNCAPSYYYIKQLVKLVLGSLSRIDQLGFKTNEPNRSQAIRDRLRGKGLPPDLFFYQSFLSTPMVFFSLPCIFSGHLPRAVYSHNSSCPRCPSLKGEQLLIALMPNLLYHSKPSLTVALANPWGFLHSKIKVRRRTRVISHHLTITLDMRTK